MNSLENKTIFENFTGQDIVDMLFRQHLFAWTSSSFMISMFTLYFVLFVIGVIGNLWVIVTLIGILRNLTLLPNQNLFVYILTLSLVDLTMIATLPVLISDAVLFHWVYGRTFCKLYLITESVNKLVSIFVLAALSFDRYLAVCRSGEHYAVRTTRGAVISVLALIALSLVLLIPVHATADQLEVEELVHVTNGTFPISVKKCLLDMNGHLMEAFTVYTFFVGFCAPSLIVVYFYAKILRYIHSHTKRVRSRIPVKRVTFATTLIVAFYLTCWSPFWVTTLYTALRPVDESSDAHDPVVAKIYYCIHSLVYVNSSLNWVFYAFLNSYLRDCQELAAEKRRLSRNNSFIRLTSFTAANVGGVPPISGFGRTL